MAEILHGLFCPVHGIIAKAIILAPLAVGGLRLAVYRLGSKKG